MQLAPQWGNMGRVSTKTVVVLIKGQHGYIEIGDIGTSFGRESLLHQRHLQYFVLRGKL